MSKSPNILIPAAGGAALVLGIAYGVATNTYANDKVDVMARQVEQAQAEAVQASEAATAEAARVAEIEKKALAIQNEARRTLASAGSTTLTEPAPLRKSPHGMSTSCLMAADFPWVRAMSGQVKRSLPSIAPRATATSPKVLTTGRSLRVGSIHSRIRTR